MNYVCISGNVTQNPTQRYIGQSQLAEFTIAINKTKKDGQKITHFVKCTAWQKTAQIALSQLQQGDKVVVEGELNYSQWTDQQSGQNRSQLTVKVNRIEPFVWKNNQQNNNQPPQNQQMPQGQYNQSPNQSSGNNYQPNNSGNANNYQPPQNPQENNQPNNQRPLW